jgi:hypothetical protein
MVPYFWKFFQYFVLVAPALVATTFAFILRLHWHTIFLTIRVV